MTSKDRLYLNAGFEKLKLDIQNLSTSTLWRGNPLLDGSLGSLNFQVGSQSSNFLEVKFADLNIDFGINEGSQAGETEDFSGILISSQIYQSLTLTYRLEMKAKI